MSSLSDKLKSLGVQVGAQNLPPPKPRNPYTIEQILSGQVLATPQGETFLVEERYPAGYQHGSKALKISAPLDALALWAGEARIGAMSAQSFAFIDTETTGLSGGTGTYAFLIGVGRFEGNDFHLAQFFLRDPAEEPAQLSALEEFLAPSEAVVSFNGKAFDIPLLNTRFLTHGWRTPFLGSPHIDLLHLARRLWGDRLPSRTLGNLEAQILGANRSEQDVPGWMIPSLYFDYMRSGDARPLTKVFYHNALDVISLAALLDHTASLLADPLNGAVQHGVDLVSLAKLFESMNDLDSACRLYIHGLEHDLPQATMLDAIQRLALIYKRQGKLESAIPLWQQASRLNHLEAHVELAKYYEHRARDYEQAKYWTQTAIDHVIAPEFPIYLRHQWLPDLKHRLERLDRKLAHIHETGDDIISNLEEVD